MAERSVVVRLRAATAEWKRDMAEAAGSLGGIGQAAGKQGGAMSKLASAGKAVGRTLAVVGGAAAASLTALTVSTIRTGIAYNTLEQTSRAALTTLLGSAEAANAQMDRLREFGSTSPFPRQVWIEAQQQLLAFGMEAERIIPTLSAIQDAVAAAGGSAIDIQEIVRVLAQVQSTGKVTAETLNQLGVRGIDAATLVGSAFGKSAAQIREEISSGTLDAQMFLTTLTDQMSARFAGAAENVRETWVGATDRVKGALRDIGSVLVEPFIDPRGGGAAVQWANDIADVLRALEAQIRSIMPELREFAGPAFERVSELLQGVAEHIRNLDLDAGKLIETIQKAAPVLLGASAGLAAMGGNSLLAVTPLKGLSNTINILVAGIAAIALTTPEFRDLLVELYEAIQPLLPVLMDTGVFLAGSLTEGIAAVASLLKPLVPVVEALVDVFTRLPEPVQQATLAVAAFAAALRFGGPVGVALSAIALLGAAVEGTKRVFGESSDAAQEWRATIQETIVDLERLGRTGKLTGDLKLLPDVFRELRDELRGTDDDLNWFEREAKATFERVQEVFPTPAELLGVFGPWVEQLRTTGDVLDEFRTKLEPVDQALADMVAAGDVDTAADAFNQLALQAAAAGISQEDLMALLPEYARQLERHAEATEDSSGEQAGLAENTRSATAALREQADELRKQNDPVFRFIRALEDVEKAQSEFNDAVDEFGEDSPEAREAALRMAEAAIELQGAAGEVGDAFDGTMTPALEAALEAAGYGSQEIEFFEQVLRGAKDALDDYAGKYPAEVLLGGVDGVISDTEIIQNRLDQLDGREVTIDIRTRIMTSGSGPAPVQGGPRFYRWGGIVKAQTGAMIPAHVTRSPTVLYGERETGEEAFIPRIGDRSRSVKILEQAASWFGMQLVSASRFAQSAVGGGLRAGTPVMSAGGGEFTGELYLDSGQFMGAVRGVIRQRDSRLLSAIGQGVGAV